MLIRMQMKNFALIDEAVFEPGKGFTGITGETGAGKSLLIDAISALCGQRTGRDSVRSGEDSAFVEAVFDNLSQTIPRSECETLGITLETDDTCILSREITSDGRSTARINGRLVTLSTLREVGQRLIDIHGQNDQQAIFRRERHIGLLDRFGGKSVFDAVSNYSSVLEEYKTCIEEIRALGSDPKAQSKRAELLLFQIRELEEAAFLKEEEEELQEKMRFLSSAEKIREGLSSFSQMIESPDEGALDRIRLAEASLSQAAAHDTSLTSQLNALTSVRLTLDGIVSDVEKYLSAKDIPLDDVQIIEKRLDLLFRCKVKYGKTIPDMLRFLDEARSEYNAIQGGEKRLKELHRQRLLIEKTLMDRADAIHHLRLEASGRLSELIRHELSDLGMNGAIFRVAINQRPRERFFSRSGYDDVEFMMSANPGEPEKPLAKVVSGGEASRIMLAIKTILASADDTPILIFDEVDAGISGATATSVAQKLSRLARTHQVLCVTHMAQIAAISDHHFLIEKNHVGQRTITSIRRLNEEDRKREIARLLSGEREDSSSLTLANQMINRRNL